LSFNAFQTLKSNTKTLDTCVLACDFGPIMDAPRASQITDGYVGWFQAQPTMRLQIIHKNLLPLNPIRTKNKRLMWTKVTIHYSDYTDNLRLMENCEIPISSKWIPLYKFITIITKGCLCIYYGDVTCTQIFPILPPRSFKTLYNVIWELPIFFSFSHLGGTCPLCPPAYATA
jgi:hypothetical protein